MSYIKNYTSLNKEEITRNELVKTGTFSVLLYPLWIFFICLGQFQTVRRYFVFFFRSPIGYYRILRPNGISLSFLRLIVL